MPVVYIPSLMRSLTRGQPRIEVAGRTVGEVVRALDNLYPGVEARLLDGNHVRPGISISVDGEIATFGLAQSVRDASEVHFLPALGGG